MNHLLRLIPHTVFSLFSLAVFVLPAFAVEEHLATPDRLVADDISFDPGEPVIAYLHAGRSYECRLSQSSVASGNDYMYFSTSVQSPSGTINATAVGNIYPAEAVVSTATIRQAARRIAFIPTETGNHSLEVLFDNNFSGSASAACFETTFYGTFNSFLASTPIVELRNRGESSIEATVTAINLDGQVLQQKNIIIPESSRNDAILDQIPPQTFGKITVTYLGPQGALSGFVAEYNYTPGPVLMRERPMQTSKIVP